LKELQFTKRLTQNSLAAKLNTNSRYLSAYINENKGVNFNKYIAGLRINYITTLLNSNNKYLNFTIEALAEECGIVARQNFSKLFFEINGIRPADYIKKRKQELGLS
jgi:YesN/AraC family two-component response regulator